MTGQEVKKAWRDYAKERGLPDSLDYAPKGVILAALKQAFRAGVEISDKQEKDSEAVIRGWAARDEDGQMWLYKHKPIRMFDYISYGQWDGEVVDTRPYSYFPDLTWNSEPVETEIIIKRKKKWK